MRAQLHERKDEIYKKSGRNPTINQQLEQLNQLEAQIRDEEAKLTTYQRYVDDKDKAERRLNNLKQNLAQLSKMHNEKQKELALHEQTQEWKSLEGSLNIEPVHFPEQGIDRYETSKSQIDTLKTDISLREEKLAQLENENNRINVAEKQDIEAINALYQQENKIKQQEFELKSLDKEIQDKQLSLIHI